MTTPLPSPNGLSQQVYDTLGDYLRCDPAALHPKDSLRDDLGLDSLQTIELVYQVESVLIYKFLMKTLGGYKPSVMS